MRDKPEYERKRAKSIYANFVERKAKIVEAHGGVCELCGVDHPKRGWHLHHRFYTEQSNYPRNSKAMSTRLKRLSEAEENPEQFAVLCEKCHYLIETIKRLVKNNSEILENLKKML